MVARDIVSSFESFVRHLVKLTALVYVWYIFSTRICFWNISAYYHVGFGSSILDIDLKNDFDTILIFFMLYCPNSVSTCRKEDVQSTASHANWLWSQPNSLNANQIMVEFLLPITEVQDQQKKLFEPRKCITYALTEEEKEACLEGDEQNHKLGQCHIYRWDLTELESIRCRSRGYQDIFLKSANGKIIDNLSHWMSWGFVNDALLAFQSKSTKESQRNKWKQFTEWFTNSLTDLLEQCLIIMDNASLPFSTNRSINYSSIHYTHYKHLVAWL